MDVIEASWTPLVDWARQVGPDPELVGLSDDEVERAVRDDASCLAALTCRWLVHVAELVVRGVWADTGARTPGQWLSWACGVSAPTAREYVRVALALRRTPAIRARFAAGTLSYSKVRAITRVATPESEGSLLELADRAPASQLERIIAGCRRQLSESKRWQDGPPDPPAEVREVRRVEVAPDVVEFRVRLGAADADAFEQGLERLADLADRADRPSEEQDGGPEMEVAPDDLVRLPRRVRRAMVLAEAVDRAIDGGTVSAETSGPVTGPDLGSASAETGTTGQSASAEAAARVRKVPVVTGRGRMGSLPAAVLARLACDGRIRVAAIHRHGRCGHPADIGRASRQVPAELRRALHLRDRHCRFPGCHRTIGLHAHHVVHWAAGGPTARESGAGLCPPPPVRA